MDEIQKILVQAGRKDLAQKYYKKTVKTAVIQRDPFKKFEDVKNRIDKQTKELAKKLKDKFDGFIINDHAHISSRGRY